MNLKHLVFIIVLYIIFGFLEKKYAAEKGQTITDRLINIFYGALLYISGILIVGFLYAIMPFKPHYLHHKSIAFSIIIAAIYLLVSDFVFYWYHRAQHYFKYFWVIHELHHSDKAMNVTTSMRTYWLERPLQTLLIVMPIYYVVGIDALAIKLYFTVSTFWLFFTHANLKLQLGIFTPIIAGPQVHRIHHSILPEHQGKNLAQFFPFYDIMFGTFYYPKHNEFPATGLSDEDVDESITNVMTKPFIAWFKFFTAKEAS